MSTPKIFAIGELDRLVSESRASPGEGEPVEWLLTPGNWLDLLPAARLCAEHGKTIRVCLDDDSGHQPVAELCLTDLFVVYQVISSWWSHLSGDGRPASVGPADFYDLLAGLRLILRARAAQPEATAEPGGSVLFRLPATHPMLVDPASALEILRTLAKAKGSPSLRQAAIELASLPRDTLAARPWLRLLLQQAWTLQETPELTAALEDLYGDESRRTRLVPEEREAMAGLGLDALADQWAQSLGIDRPRRQAPAFAVPVTEPPPASEATADVTVLIPAFRHEAYIEQTLHSVQAQTHAALAILVVDDRSPDATADRARDVRDPRLEVRTNERNLGLGGSVLAAVETIRTPYVALLNSDDLFHPERLARCLAALQEPGAQLVATGLALIDSVGNRLQADNVRPLFDGRSIQAWVEWYEKTRPRSVAPERLFGELLERNFLATSSNIVCRTDFLRRNADALRNLKYCLDWQLFLAAANEGGLVYLPEELLGYRLHATNTVWFRDGHRWSYSLEVNRVAARAIHDHLARLPPESDERALAALDDLTRHVAENTEAHCMGLYLHELVDGLTIERVSQHRPEAQAALRAIDRRPDATTALPAPSADEVLYWLDRDELGLLRGSERWLRQRLDETEAQLAVEWRKVHETWQALQSSEKAREAATGVLERLQVELAARQGELAALRAQLSSVETELAARQGELAALGAQLSSVETELAASRAESGVLAGARDALAAELALERAARQTEVDSIRADLASLRQALENALRREQTSRLAAEAVLFEERARAHQQRHVESAELRGAHLPGHTWWRTAVRRGRKWRQKARLLRQSLGIVFFRWTQRLARKPPCIVVAVDLADETTMDKLSVLERLGPRVCAMSWERRAGAATSDGPAKSLVLHAIPEYLHRDARWWRRRAPERLAGLLGEIASAGGVAGYDPARDGRVLRALSLARLAAACRPAYVHATTLLESALSACLTARLLDLPWGVEVDHLPPDEEPPTLWLLGQLASAAVVTAGSAAIRAGLLEQAKCQPDRVIERAPPVAAISGPRRPAGAEAVFVSALTASERHGWLLLIQAAAQLRSQGLGFALHLIGTRDLTDLGSLVHDEWARGMASSLDLGKHVVFHASTPAIRADHLGRATAFVAPLADVGRGIGAIPVGLLEAMAAGVPVVVSDALPVQGVVRDGIDGLVFAQSDAAALAAALQRLATQHDLARRLGEAGRASYLERFAGQRTEQELQTRIREKLGCPAQKNPVIAT